MTILQIKTAPDAVLYQKSLKVSSVDSNVKKLMDNMLETMYLDNGIGLAANQVGVLKRVLVIDMQNSAKAKTGKYYDNQIRPEGFYPICMANPKIVKYSGELVEAEEGCLSLPKQKIVLQRPKQINVKYIDYNNKEQELKADGWLARVIQHEIDHLDGKLLIDYISEC